MTTGSNGQELSPLAQVIHDVLDQLPHATRLYPDVYAEQVAATVELTFRCVPKDEWDRLMERDRLLVAKVGG